MCFGNELTTDSAATYKPHVEVLLVLIRNTFGINSLSNFTTGNAQHKRMSTFNDAPRRRVVGINATQQIVCSSVSGCLGIFVGYPMDSVRVRLQTATSGKYKGVADCIIKITREEGFLRLYGGMMAPISVAAVRQSVIFGSNRVISQAIDRTPLSKNTKLLAAGILTGICNRFVSPKLNLLTTC
jgi:solute carrier family 25 carnitine/acylcarnitine transporter 20/29